MRRPSASPIHPSEETSLINRATAPDIRDRPAYSIHAAARHLGMAAATLRYWVFGRLADGGRSAPPGSLIRAPAGPDGLVSFNNLVEAHVLRALRTASGVRATAVRKAIRYAEAELGVERLLLREELQTSKPEILLNKLAHLIALSRSGRFAMKRMLQIHLERVDRDGHGLPFRLHPLCGPWAAGRKPVAIDPNISFGQPTIAGTGIATAAIVDRVDAGEDLHALAKDYNIKVAAIRDAVLYERAA